jgi:hypothetical protein
MDRTFSAPRQNYSFSICYSFGTCVAGFGAQRAEQLRMQKKAGKISDG